MSDRIPKIIDPIYLAERNRIYKGVIPLSSFVRLDDKVMNKEDSVSFELDFTRIGKLPVIEGYIEAKIQLECQSCLQFLEFSVNSDVKIAIVLSDEEASLIPGDYEPLLFVEENIPFTDIIEDELLLALPIIAKHDYDCFDRPEPEITIENTGRSEQESPFSVLANFKKTGA